MSFKMPGLLKSPAFGVGAFQAINVRYDRMAENAEKYKLAAQKRGQELFAEHKVTSARLKAENKGKIYVAKTYGETMADWLDDKGVIGMMVGEGPDKYYDRLETEVGRVQDSGGVPEDFVANENMYYGEQRFEDQTTSYNKVQNFMDTQNNVFGSSFGLLMEENTPEKMTKEQFGVREREGMASLDRKVPGTEEGIKTIDETRLMKLVGSRGSWGKHVLVPAGDGGYFIEPTGEFMRFKMTVSNAFAGQHYVSNTDRSDTGAGVSAETGVAVANAIVGYANQTQTVNPETKTQYTEKQMFDNAMADLDAINMYIAGEIVMGDTAWDTAIQYSTNLYLASLEKKIGVSAYKNLSASIRREVAERHNIQIIPPYYGAGVTQAGAGTQAETNI